jgi:hypothetical protein
MQRSIMDMRSLILQGGIKHLNVTELREVSADSDMRIKVYEMVKRYDLVTEEATFGLMASEELVNRDRLENPSDYI